MPTPFPLNWNPNQAHQSVDHTRHEAVAAAPALTTLGIEDRIYADLRDFTHFDGRHNEIAVVYGKHIDGVCYAMFDTVGVFGWASSWMNPRVVPVRISCSSLSRKATGDTAGRHMLVGQRQWWVERRDDLLMLATEAYERPCNILNTIGMYVCGRFAQMSIWRAYLLNICDAHQLTATVKTAGPTRVDATPWVPTIPYPGCDCRI